MGFYVFTSLRRGSSGAPHSLLTPSWQRGDISAATSSYVSAKCSAHLGLSALEGCAGTGGLQRAGMEIRGSKERSWPSASRHRVRGSIPAIPQLLGLWAAGEQKQSPPSIWLARSDGHAWDTQPWWQQTLPPPPAELPCGACCALGGFAKWEGFSSPSWAIS